MHYFNNFTGQNMITEQQAAPDFSVLDEHKKTVHLRDFRGKKNVVLYFYPKDDTPGCTIEANQFTSFIDDFAAHDTLVYGVSKDNCASHTDFINKFDLKVGLLADTDGKMCQDYGVWQEKERNGEKSMGIVRSTFIIDKNGIVRFAEYNVSPDGHASVMLDIIKKLS
jgi:peroxiredoxin Q/BCP